jgi:2-C-methyl-D-erythritol 2,4-cyclodiphosphate synthase
MPQGKYNLKTECPLRIGTGFDIHRLVPGRKLILGGIYVPYELGLEGHSDGDVLLHSIMDALLGAANLGEIGIFFPPDDARFSGADSANLLIKVREMLLEKQYAIVNLDSVIICQRPKLAHLYAQMRSKISELLLIDINKISVKAKTAEGLGQIGQAQAIAVQTSALIISAPAA